jgi:hypothetical protein
MQTATRNLDLKGWEGLFPIVTVRLPWLGALAHKSGHSLPGLASNASGQPPHINDRRGVTLSAAS